MRSSPTRQPTCGSRSLQTSLDEWQYLVDLNLTSVFVLRAGGRPEDGKGGGSIVLLASMMSFTGGVNVAAYAATKGGVAQLTKALSNEVAGQGVRVNAVAPGYVETEVTSTIDGGRRREIDARIPLGRWGQPDEIADAIAFLLSDDARYVTGIVLPVDGGFSGR